MNVKNETKQGGSKWSAKQALYRSPESWFRGYKTYFMLNSTEHEILTAHKN